MKRYLPPITTGFALSGSGNQVNTILIPSARRLRSVRFTMQAQLGAAPGGYCTAVVAPTSTPFTTFMYQAVARQENVFAACVIAGNPSDYKCENFQEFMDIPLGDRQNIYVIGNASLQISLCYIEVTLGWL